MALDQDKLQRFLQKALDEIGATFHASLVVIGDQLGLYKAMAGAGPLTPVELAERTNTAERYVREWLAAQAASGYVTYESTTGRFLLSEEQAFALGNQAGEARLREVVTAGGFTRFHRAAETPFNLVFEARP